MCVTSIGVCCMYHKHCKTLISSFLPQIPPIDSSSEEGRTLSPEEFTPVVELKNVDFTYPSRPDVQVSER